MTPVPQGYRQGFITAITVMIAFSLAFIRFWTFEASGTWSIASFVAAVGLTLARVLQIVARVRALRLEDDDGAHNRITVRWFGTAAVYAGKL